MPYPPSISPDPAGRLPELIAQALDLPAAERTAFLEEACAGDPGLLAEARSLLDQGSDGDFLETPVFVLDRAETEGRAGGELTPGARLGDCQIIRFLGQGGMGEVALAQDTKLERRVAVKLLKRSLDDVNLLRRFRHERRVLAALNHPNIARLYGGDTTPEGRSYLVMEYVEGERLDKFCDARGLNVTERLALFRKVCAAVAYAHQNLVVHRDLKPANIRVTPEGEPKLLDFGIAKLLDPDGTAAHVDPTVTMQGAMTPEYASPEQIKGEPITTASDVYSLGVVLYELLCGQRPFAHLKGRRPDELARAVCEEEPPRPSTVASLTSSMEVTKARSIEPVTATATTTKTRSATLRRQLEGDLDNIVVKALQKDPARRYPSVLALSEDLRRHSEGLPVRARRDTLRYRTGKFVRRNKVGVAATALVVCALVAGLVTAIWQARLARQERDRAQAALAQSQVSQKQAEHVSDFLQSLLAGGGPTKLDKDVRVAQVVDAAAARIDHDLANEPAVLAKAHQTLSSSYYSLGVYEPAEQQLRAALTLVRRLHGTEAPATAEVEVALGNLLSNRTKYAEAEPLLRHALAIDRSQVPPDRAALAAALSALSFTLYDQPGRSAEAETLSKEALGDARAVWGEHDARYLRVLSDLGAVKAGAQDYDGAAIIFRQLLALQDQIAPGGPESLRPQLNLCICLFNTERFGELELVLNRLDADIKRLVGENTHFSALAIITRGLLNMARGENGEAISYLQKALGPALANYPPESLNVVQVQASLGLCLTRDGRAAEGEKLLRAAYEHGGKVNRAEFAHTIGNLDVALGECLLAQKRYGEAEPLLMTGYADLEKRLGSQNRLTVQARQHLQELYTAWDKPEQAARFAAAAPAAPASMP